uniref:YsnF/AvaK domain-containing protein n=1 Tax=Streptomyces triticisoli TaxID=2182797 RepID=UPI000E3C1C16
GTAAGAAGGAAAGTAAGAAARSRAGERARAGDRSRTEDDAMTRSEERMHVGVERREAGRARLRKYVVTEDVEQTVPVRHEEVRVEREPITDANRDAALSGPEISEAEHEVTLHEERPVVETETVPVERVRLTTEERTEQETVRGKVRKERIEGEAEGVDEIEDRGRGEGRGEGRGRRR